MYLDTSVIVSIILVILMVGGSIYAAIFVRNAMKRDAKKRDR
jgi:hypothetical protein